LHGGELYTRFRKIPDYHYKLKKTRHFQYCAFLISDNKITYFCLMIQECLIIFMRRIDTFILIFKVLITIVVGSYLPDRNLVNFGACPR
jgi:hypothetical protein